VPAMVSSAHAERLQPQAMLMLMKGGAPNAEILLAKGLEELIAVGVKHGISMELPILPEGPEESTSGPPSEDERPYEAYDVRRYTAPPSAYEPTGFTASTAALQRARIRRELSARTWEADCIASPGSGASFSSDGFE